MDWHKILADIWTHLSPFVYLAAAYLILYIWKTFWTYQKEQAKIKLAMEESLLQRARMVLAEAMLHVEESESKALRDIPGGITADKGKELLNNAWKLAEAEVKPLTAGIIKDAETWAKSVIVAELAKWKEVKKLPFGIPSPKLNTTLSTPVVSVDGKGPAKLPVK